MAKKNEEETDWESTLDAGFMTPNEVREGLEEDEAVEADEPKEATEVPVAGSIRVTEPPASTTVTFKAVRPFTWGGHKLATGVEYEWDEELFDAMMYELNLRTDRLRFVERTG